MAYRKRMKRAHSRKDFRKKSGIHPINNPIRSIRRGGMRL